MHYSLAVLATAAFTAVTAAQQPANTSDWLFLPTGAMLRFPCTQLVVERLDP